MSCQLPQVSLGLIVRRPDGVVPRLRPPTGHRLGARRRHFPTSYVRTKNWNSCSRKGGFGVFCLTTAPTLWNRFLRRAERHYLSGATVLRGRPFDEQNDASYRGVCCRRIACVCLSCGDLARDVRRQRDVLDSGCRSNGRSDDAAIGQTANPFPGLEVSRK